MEARRRKNIEQEWEDVIVEGKKQEGFDPSMKLHYTRVVCGRNSRRQFRLNLILCRFRIRRSAAMKPEGCRLVSRVSHSRGLVDLS